jgi:hypothetical protein
LLAGYLSKRDDPANFPSREFPEILDRYESLFGSALVALRLSKEAIRKRPEFNFDSGDAGNLESAIAVLRAVEALRLAGFRNVTLLNPPGADILCERNGQAVCCEVKAITKQSRGQEGRFFEDQLYMKIKGHIGKVRTQLESASKERQCDLTMYICVVNWFDQSIYLGQQSYQELVNRLEKERREDNTDEESLKGIDAAFFVLKMGNYFWFVNERARAWTVRRHSHPNSARLDF